MPHVSRNTHTHMPRTHARTHAHSHKDSVLFYIITCKSQASFKATHTGKSAANHHGSISLVPVRSPDRRIIMALIDVAPLRRPTFVEACNNGPQNGQDKTTSCNLHGKALSGQHRHICDNMRNCRSPDIRGSWRNAAANAGEAVSLRRTPPVPPTSSRPRRLLP